MTFCFFIFIRKETLGQVEFIQAVDFAISFIFGIVLPRELPMRSQKIEILAAGTGLGGPTPKSAQGPRTLLKADLSKRLQTLGIQVEQEMLFDAPPPSGHPKDPKCRYVEDLAPFLRKLYDATKSVCSRGNFPLVLGGDHSLAIGTVKGVADQLREEMGKDATLGLLWVDAHPDIHNLSTTISGNIHGMSASVLLGEGHADLVGIGERQPAISKEHLAYVGLRDVDRDEKRIIKEKGIYAASMKEVDQYGLGKVMEEALEVVTQADAFVVSLDLDVIDPQFAPAVATPVRGGFTLRESHLVMELVAEQEKLRSVEIVEFNPSRDEQTATQDIALDLIESSLGKSIL